MDKKLFQEKFPELTDVSEARETLWINPALRLGAVKDFSLTMLDVVDADDRLRSFAPFIKSRFPETQNADGLIESPLTETVMLRDVLNSEGAGIFSLLIKRDSDLPIAGSVKARGGIYEILLHTEKLAIENGLLNIGESPEKLLTPKCREFFSRYKVQVGSTGNLGLSIGIMSAAIGYSVTVHMSSDAREWKKALLREHGVNVVEYASDYSAAVKEGRRLSDADPMSYFVDDENSIPLFLGYAVAALRLVRQLSDANIQVDEEHPLFVYIPCGVGGAPGGITFGLKLCFGDAVHVFYVEPTQAPCMLLGLATGLYSAICVQDAGLTGKTHADGLAVGRPSGFVGKAVQHMLSGEFTVEDAKLYDYMRLIEHTSGLFIEPSGCAALQGPRMLLNTPAGRAYCKDLPMQNATHILWATGGRLVPESIREEYRATRL